MADGKIELVEVGPRDGLQNEPETIATINKVALIESMIAYGARRRPKPADP